MKLKINLQLLILRLANSKLKVKNSSSNGSTSKNPDIPDADGGWGCQGSLDSKFRVLLLLKSKVETSKPEIGCCISSIISLFQMK